MNPISETHNTDCMEYMATIPDKFFDLAIVDPPYGIQADNMTMGSNKGYISTAKKLKSKGRLNSAEGKLKNRLLNNSDASWDIPPSEEYFKELFRISKNQFIWGGNYFPLPPTRGIVFWDKMQPWENFSQFELAWTSFDCTAKLVRMSTRGGSNKEQRIHPTQKPVDLYAWIYKNYAKDGYKIFDSHLGSGSNRIAAYKLGFDFYACEINKEYFDAQEERFRRECLGEIKMIDGKILKQQTLFDI